MANNTRKNTALNAGYSDLGPFERLELWAGITRRQSDALRRATMAIELAEVLWSRMTGEQRMQLENDAQIGYLMRQVTNEGHGF